MKKLIGIAAAVAVLGMIAPQVFRRTDCRISNIASAGVQNLSTVLAKYHEDERAYPGTTQPDRENEFPEVFSAIYGDRIAAGQEPYIEFRDKDLAVWDSLQDDYRPAKADEIKDPTTRKYLIDPWGNPYVYRRDPRGYVLYSIGADRIDQTHRGERGDDIVVRFPSR